MSDDLNRWKYAVQYNEGATRALASEICGSDDNLLRADRPSFRRRLRKFLKDAAMKLGLL